MARPQNIGIKAIELYFPSQCVEQKELEKFDRVSEGKYTIGLGQTKMSFCDDREDIYSIALTAVSSLMRKYSIEPESIGRLEVGTETLLDKSKSVKSVLMQLFQDANPNIEGVDTVNACYGGTNALFNAVNWLESSAWDGRDAIVVAGDIALYGKGTARPTGGAGCVAMVVGTDAPLVLDPGLRGTFMRHAYDFYKPDLTSEYPHVDGQLSLQCYAEAVDKCYEAYLGRKTSLNVGTNGILLHESPHSNAHGFDYMCFHAPTCKTVAKSYARLFYNDFRSDPGNALFKDIPAELSTLSSTASLVDKRVEKEFMALSKKSFVQRVQPATFVPAQCGNMYCASLYSGLCGLLSLIGSQDLQGKRIGMFSYGSGLASSMFSLKVVGSTEEIRAKLDLLRRLDERRVVAPEVYDEMCQMRECAHQRKNFKPAGSTNGIIKGAYYLREVDDAFRRFYDVKE
ncbi:hydroxymethylglutaryl-CoA synthase [Coniochaeta ligniaria NRRL 30616]|uniref:Hydroxymethylglutaryl-CoA synthase n=1 Tax=Coniochaeta ligniaria NRRL 30616 TaxID=1408157 RepID=A0A1J7IXW5_9PEZI|nr:hydroxymethylglutaryl-CoA synthase [Coniochaeta ligniaria NRRL 30616]